MRPETFRYKVNTAIRILLMTGDAKRLEELLPTMKKYWAKYAKDENDYRNGYETYGYSNDDRSTLAYISDRWGCAFRLRWLIDGLEDGHFKEQQ